MANAGRIWSRVLWTVFLTALFVVLAYYLLQEIPHAQRPTLVPSVTISTSPTS